MFGRIIDAVWMLKGYMASAVGLSFLLWLLYRISLRRFRWDGKSIRLHGFLLICQRGTGYGSAACICAW